MKTINQTKLEFWEELDKVGGEQAQQDWLDFYREAQELFDAEFVTDWNETQTAKM